MHPAVRDITGQTFGKLTALKQTRSVGDSRSQIAIWLFSCACGNSYEARGADVRSGKTTSCGCRKKTGELRRTHGLSKAKVFSSWQNMKRRCFDEKNQNFDRYGGRGIKVADRWLNFEDFLADVGMPPTPTHTLDRINNDGNYEPGNCRWATRKEQTRNRNTDKYIVDGKRYRLCEIEEVFKINYATFLGRLKRGWEVSRAAKEALWSKRRSIVA